MKLVKNIIESKFFPPAAISFIAIISAYKTINFYFWHDDFSTFYSARIGKCIFPWPYGSYCSIFSFLEKIFAYNAPYYFILGLVLFILCSIALYVFLGKIFSRNTALVLAVIFSTGYIGAGTFLEAYDSNTSYLSLGILFLSLSLLFSTKKSKWGLLPAFLTYFLSIIILQARSSTYIFVVVGVLLTFLRERYKENLKTIVASFVSLHGLTYLAFFLINRSGSVGDSSWGRAITGMNLHIKIVQFFQTLGSFLLTDGIQLNLFPRATVQQLTDIRFVLGVLITLLIGFYIFSNRKSKTILNTGILAAVWVVFLYMPYGLRSDVALWSTHRYLLFAFPGVLIAWGLFGSLRFWMAASLFIILANVIQINIYFKPYGEAGVLRSSFYRQLHMVMPEIADGSILFFGYPARLTNTFADFFRVGFLPSEASIATEYKMDYKDLTLLTDARVAARELSGYKGDRSRIFTFYYDGNSVANTTEDARNFMEGKITNNLSFDDSIIRPSQGKNDGISFKVEKYSPLPSKMTIDMAVGYQNDASNYTSPCVSGDCPDLSRELYAKVLDYLTRANNISNSVLNNSVTSYGESTASENLLDGDVNTYWIPNKYEWGQGLRPSINISFRNGVDLGGIVLTSDIRRNRPAKLEISVDGKIVSSRSEGIKEKQKYIFDGRNVKNLSVKILGTAGGEAPIIKDIELIPFGLTDVNLDDINLVKEKLSRKLNDQGTEELLQKYLASGVASCVKIGAKGGSGQSSFRVFADGKRRTYQVNLPAASLEDYADLKLGCFNYPVWVRIYSAGLSY